MLVLNINKQTIQFQIIIYYLKCVLYIRVHFITVYCKLYVWDKLFISFKVLQTHIYVLRFAFLLYVRRVGVTRVIVKEQRTHWTPQEGAVVHVGP